MVQAYVIVDRCSSMLMLGSNFSCFLTQTKMLFTINETEGLLWRGDGSEGEREKKSLSLNKAGQLECRCTPLKDRVLFYFPNENCSDYKDIYNI